MDLWPKNLEWSWQQSSSAGLPGIPGGEKGEGTLGIATFGTLILCISCLYETLTGLANFCTSITIVIRPRYKNHSIRNFTANSLKKSL